MFDPSGSALFRASPLVGIIITRPVYQKRSRTVPVPYQIEFFFNTVTSIYKPCSVNTYGLLLDFETDLIPSTDWLIIIDL
mgnify:FL=1